MPHDLAWREPPNSNQEQEVGSFLGEVEVTNEHITIHTVLGADNSYQSKVLFLHFHASEQANSKEQMRKNP